MIQLNWNKILKRILISGVLLLFFQPLLVFAQTVISGRVTFEDGRPAEGFVMAFDVGQQAVTNFIRTDEGGYYKLEYPSQADSICLKVSGMTFDSKMITIVNRSQQIDFSVVEKKQELKPVSVKVEKVGMREDTINYNVDSYIGQDDRVIGDVLKNMPGLDVEENGTIKYNGKSISNFYIEDMDLLQGRYGLAVNNISANDVAKVQVLENHQPIKALQNNGPGNGIAVNIKLKDAAKNSIKQAVTLGAGGQDKGNIGRNPLWLSELTNMFFGERQQNISLYKGNNSGLDIAKELNEHYNATNNVNLNPLCPISAVLPSDSDLPQKRSFDNQSHIFSINHLKKTKKETELNFNAEYSVNKVSREGASVSNCYLNDSNRLLVEENLASVSRENNLNLQTRYCRNVKNFFLSDVFNFSTNWMTDEVETSMSSQLRHNNSNTPMNSEVIRQSFKHPQLKIDNTLDYIHTVGRHTVDMHLSAGYSERRNSLQIDIAQIDSVEEDDFLQNITSRHIAANAYSDYTLRVKDYYYTCGATAYVNFLGFKSHLEPCPFPDVVTESDVCNDFWYNTYGVDINHCLTYKARHKELSFGCPIRLFRQQLSNRSAAFHNSYARILFSPYLLLRHSLEFWNYECIASYNKNVGDVNDSYTGYLMNNYRTFQHSYVDYLCEKEQMDIAATIKFRSPLHFSFVDIEARYGHGWSNQMNNYDYQGATTLIGTNRHATASDNYSIGIRFDKGFELLQSKLTLFANQSYFDGERMVNSQIYDYQYNVTGMGIAGTLTLYSRLNFVLSSGHNWSGSRVCDATSQEIIYTTTQRLKTNFYATRRLSVSLIIEDDFNSRSVQDRHAWIADLSAVLKLKQFECDIQLNNLFNQREYTRVYYSGMDIYSSTCQLRPLNVLVAFRFNIN